MVWQHRRTEMLCSTVIVLTLASAGVQPNTVLWAHESKYYVVKSNLPTERAEYIGRVMDATGKEYARRFQDFRGVIRQKPQVKVYSNRDQYLSAVARACGEPNVHARGIHCGIDGIVYTYDGDGLERILKHECFHQFAHVVIDGSLATWTNEGLAEYFEEGLFDEQSGELKLGAVPAWRLELLRQAQQQDTLIPIDKLLYLSGQEWEDNMAGKRGAVQYSQAWLLCHFLVHAEDGKYRPLFEEYLHHLDRGLDPDSAFKRVFGPDTKPLEGKLNDYIRKLKPCGARAG